MSKHKKKPKVYEDDLAMDEGADIKGYDMRKGSCGRNSRFPFIKLTKPGQSFFVPKVTKPWMRPYVYYANTHFEARFEFGWDYCRKIDGKWKQCGEKDEGATLGIRVKRVK